MSRPCVRCSIIAKHTALNPYLRAVARVRLQNALRLHHALVDAAIAERVAGERFGRAGRARGQLTVSLDDDGNLVEITPDGHRHLL